MAGSGRAVRRSLGGREALGPRRERTVPTGLTGAAVPARAGLPRRLPRPRGLDSCGDEACHSGCRDLLLGLGRRDLRVHGFREEVENFARSFLPGHS